MTDDKTVGDSFFDVSGLPGADDVQDDPLVGTVLDGRFRLDRLLGEGGMGRVYAGTQLSVEREVAIKLLRGEALAQRSVKERFLREAKVISGFSHPNIVRLIDFGEDTERRLPYLVMELVRGVSLAELTRRGRLALPLALEIAYQVCGALVQAHAAGIIHRDLKPDNLQLVPVVGDTFQAKVLDFGIAFPRESNTRITATGMICGTAYYVAPEQARATEVDGRADLYALGIILYEMLSGHLPFRADSDFQILVDAGAGRAAAVVGVFAARRGPRRGDQVGARPVGQVARAAAAVGASGARAHRGHSQAVRHRRVADGRRGRLGRRLPALAAADGDQRADGRGGHRVRRVHACRGAPPARRARPDHRAGLAGRCLRRARPADGARLQRRRRVEPVAAGLAVGGRARARRARCRRWRGLPDGEENRRRPARGIADDDVRRDRCRHADSSSAKTSGTSSARADNPPAQPIDKPVALSTFAGRCVVIGERDTWFHTVFLYPEVGELMLQGDKRLLWSPLTVKDRRGTHLSISYDDRRLPKPRAVDVRASDDKLVFQLGADKRFVCRKPAVQKFYDRLAITGRFSAPKSHDKLVMPASGERFTLGGQEYVYRILSGADLAQGYQLAVREADDKRAPWRRWKMRSKDADEAVTVVRDAKKRRFVSADAARRARRARHSRSHTTKPATPASPTPPAPNPVYTPAQAGLPQGVPKVAEERGPNGRRWLPQCHRRAQRANRPLPEAHQSAALYAPSATATRSSATPPPTARRSRPPRIASATPCKTPCAPG